MGGVGVVGLLAAAAVGGLVGSGLVIAAIDRRPGARYLQTRANGVTYCAGCASVLGPEDLVVWRADWRRERGVIHLTRPRCADCALAEGLGTWGEAPG